AGCVGGAGRGDRRDQRAAVAGGRPADRQPAAAGAARPLTWRSLRPQAEGDPVPYFLIRKSSGFLPFLTSAAIQRGCLPRPVQVSSGLAGVRYFGATFPSLRPWREAFFAGAFFAAREGVPLATRPPNSSSMEYPSAAPNSTIRLRIAVMGLRFFSAVLRSRAALISASSCWGESVFRSIAIQILRSGKREWPGPWRAAMVVECATQTKRYFPRKRVEAIITGILPPDIQPDIRPGFSRRQGATTRPRDRGSPIRILRARDIRKCPLPGRARTPRSGAECRSARCRRTSIPGAGRDRPARCRCRRRQARDTGRRPRPRPRHCPWD